MWLDPTLSYKFILKDSSDVSQWTVDNVIGLLTANSVATASLQDLSVTTAKLNPDCVTANELADHATVDASRAVTTNHIRNNAITRAKIISDAFIPPVLRKYTANGTHNKCYTFQITSGNAVAGDTYTNNAITYTVYRTVSASTIVQLHGPGAPSASGTLTRASGSGDLTLTFGAVMEPIYADAVAQGAGGGGGPSGTTVGGTPGNGGNTTVGGTLLVANGGSGCTNSAAYPAAPTGSVGTGVIERFIIPGGGGQPGGFTRVAYDQPGGVGGTSFFGGAGPGGGSIGVTATGGNASANSGSGGGGSGVTNTINMYFGGGGRAGATVRGIIPNASLSSSIAIVIGTKGTGGTAGTSGFAGGDGADGRVEIEEHYQ